MAHVDPIELARQIHQQGVRLVLAVTGGGSGAIATLLAVPGASRSILAAAVPYSTSALDEWLSGTPDEYCSAWTARAMAMAAYLKAQVYDPQAVVAGVGCTASLASDRPKRGPHRVHLAFQTASTTGMMSLELEKGRRSRAEEEQLVSQMTLNQVAEASGLEARLDTVLTNTERPEIVAVTGTPGQQDLLANRVRSTSLVGDASPPRAIFPGAFHPLHHGHVAMAESATRLLGCPVAFEISIVNAQKPPLDFIEIDQRARQFSNGQSVWLSRAPHFSQKAELFPGATFVVGADTLARVAQAQFYASEEAMQQAFEKIASLGCHFLVFGRVVDGQFQSLANLQIPDSLRRLCREVPESDFRRDVSSSEIRRDPSG